MRWSRSVSSTIVLASAAFALPVLPALAQSTPEEVCAQLADPQAEIACLREALADSRRVASGETEERQAAAPEPAPAPRAQLDAHVPSQELGEEQAARRLDRSTALDRREDGVATAVIDFRTDRRGRLVMQLENQQIWRQVDTVGLPVLLDEEERIPVEITRSGFGGYRMAFPEIDRRIAVLRLR